MFYDSNNKYDMNIFSLRIKKRRDKSWTHFFFIKCTIVTRKIDSASVLKHTTRLKILDKKKNCSFIIIPFLFILSHSTL